jgi:dTDP-glucose 4,6-dehydratase
MHHGEPGETCSVGTGVETHNIDMAHLILKLLNKPATLIQHVTDRPGHDRRYSLNCDKLKALGWRSAHSSATLVRTTRGMLDKCR